MIKKGDLLSTSRAVTRRNAETIREGIRIKNICKIRNTPPAERNIPKKATDIVTRSKREKNNSNGEKEYQKGKHQYITSITGGFLIPMDSSKVMMKRKSSELMVVTGKWEKLQSRN